ncbi:MAG TPA: hypothetical protein VKA03_09335 [Methylovirgula sp.]|nr:hypothetical protein [Methylovirgula sp.]
MKKLIGAALLGSAVLTAQAMAQTPTPPAKCRVAEVNPVTNHAHCIDPVGAPLDVQSEKPCQGMHQTGQWTMSNGCDTTPAGVPPSK